jgi:pimeloyl-ACP methyl ester carboxylesterase
MTEIRSRRAAVNGIELDVIESGPDDGPVVILSHGFPESSWSWRHQLPALGDAGWHAIAPDQRGYGRSSKPESVDAYGTDSLSADLLGLVDETGQEQAVFVGHDWGALIVWDLIRLRPERVRGVVGVSVPFVNWPAPPIQLFRQAFGDDFFYIVYFQEVGPAEKELGADVRRTMRNVLWSASAAGADQERTRRPAVGTGFLDVMGEWPEELPAWLTADDLDRYTAAFEASGFFGPVSYYRNLDADYERVKDISPDMLTMPSFFIGGDLDMVVALDPSGVERMRQQLPGYRGDVIIPGVGHWTQQEAPDAFNDALLGFLATLDV